VKETIPGIGVQVVTVPKGQAMARVKAYSSNARVAYAEPDFVVQAAGAPDDPYLSEQWALTMVKAADAWGITVGRPDVTVAILDTGIDLDHPDLASKIISNVNFTTSPTVDGICSHGTHVAGIAAACTNNGIGIAGLGYSSSLMNVKVIGDDGLGYYSWVTKGVIWAADNGARVINLSLGGSSASSTLESAVNYAWNKGVVVVAAAGNDGNSTPCYPAYYTNCIAVAATDWCDNLASWSNRGDWVDVAAPGRYIYSTVANNSYDYMGGTSMASPHVAGLAALVFTVATDTNGNGRLNDEVRARIQATCDDIGVSGIGAGRINAYKAVAGGTTIPPAPTTGSIAGKVTDATGGLPIAGASLSDGTRTASTDASGQYTITGVPEGTYTVEASAAGDSASSQAVSVVAGQTTTANFALAKLPSPGSIAGKITDSADGSPIAGATVSDRVRMGSTDANGQYIISGVPEGIYTVTASAAGYSTSSQTVSVSAGQTSTANFALTKLASAAPEPLWVQSIAFGMSGKNLRLTVKVVSKSGAVAGAQVAVGLTNGVQNWNFSGTTDTAGLVTFMVSKPPAGTYVASIADVGATGYIRDTTQGMLSATYVLKGGGGKK
jgi:thermitase